MRFLVEIELGNDAMQTGHDVAEALRGVAINVDVDFAEWNNDNDQGTVHDTNGNRVGTCGIRSV